MGACPGGPRLPHLRAAPPPPRAPQQGLCPGSPAGTGRPYLVRRPQQPVDPGQLGAESEVLAKREQRRPAGLGEVGAVERVRVVQELHPASQRGHDASLPLGARAPGPAGPRAGTPGSRREQGRPRPPLAGSRARRLRRARLQPGLRPRGAGRGRGPRAPLSPPSPAPPLLRPLAPGPAAPARGTCRGERERENGWRGIRSPAPSPLPEAAGRGSPAGRLRQHVRPSA